MSMKPPPSWSTPGLRHSDITPSVALLAKDEPSRSSPNAGEYSCNEWLSKPSRTWQKLAPSSVGAWRYIAVLSEMVPNNKLTIHTRFDAQGRIDTCWRKVCSDEEVSRQQKNMLETQGSLSLKMKCNKAIMLRSSTGTIRIKNTTMRPKVTC